MNEDELLGWLKRRLRTKKERDHLRDDTATLEGSGALVVTVDQQVEGVHFAPGLDARVVGRRLLAVNLSDLAASGATPRWAFLALQLPRGLDPKPLYAGLLAACRRHRVMLAGGDVSSGPALAASLTLIGQRAPGAAALSRDRARPGHALYLGGTVGESALGRALLERGARWTSGAVRLPRSLALPPPMVLAARRAVKRHLLPEPQLALGRAIAALPGAGAAIDLSDGFSRDLSRLCRESGVGARVEATALVRASPPGFDALCSRLRLDPDALRLGGGEDYVLLFTMAANTAPPGRFRCTKVGEIVRGHRIFRLDAAGRRETLAPAGWDHLLRG
jgi:thiamine-monophosphate kinase